jgi:hypothetical protein
MSVGAAGPLVVTYIDDAILHPIAERFGVEVVIDDLQRKDGAPRVVGIVKIRSLRSDSLRLGMQPSLTLYWL